ncbi:sorting nexin-22 [Sinocyclocheilus rhinocerous]|uniref:Sorting nexin-24-like n=1 Tax=Sinocyclocheilus rhinocerous TaxID=307959 RepID=A0A673L177_9TELE|nr:PREDICTED: sorting nexin-24-like [Sinocyclocheilus rhinocerous]
MLDHQCVSPVIEVFIPSLMREVDETGKLRKLFRLEILFSGRKHFVLRRHSEFQTLHRKLKKILRAPDFPSKRNQHLRTKPLEQRRQELEDYIQEILYRNDVVPQELLDFLQVKHFHSASKNCSSDENQSDDCQEQGYSFKLFNQRVVGFSADPYQLESRSDLPDIVVAGVLQGLYPRDVKVSFKKSCAKPSGLTSAPELPVHPKIPTITINRSNISSLPESQRI